MGILSIYVLKEKVYRKVSFRIKNSKVAYGVGLWCFAFTAFACIMGMFPKGLEAFTSQWYFQISLNILTPFVLIGLGLILPFIAKRKNNIKEL